MNCALIDVGSNTIRMNVYVYAMKNSGCCFLKKQLPESFLM